MSKTTVRQLVKKAAEAAGVRPYVAGAGREDSSDVSPHTFRHSITFRMLPSYAKALHWFAAWKLLDLVSTYIAFNYSPLHLKELNPLINLIEPVTGFTAALVLATPLTFAILYGVHRWNLVVSEVLALMLPFVVLGNFLTVVSEGLHLAVFGMTIGVVIGYFGCLFYRDWKHTGSWSELLRIDSDPLFWQPIK